MAIRNSEEYLVKVKNKNSKFSSFDMLIYKTYNDYYLISDLPPTNATMHLHILRDISTDKFIKSAKRIIRSRIIWILYKR